MKQNGAVSSHWDAAFMYSSIMTPVVGQVSFKMLWCYFCLQCMVYWMGTNNSYLGEANRFIDYKQLSALS
jgi:hypothetical protein